ncbi:MAG: oxidoreductase, coenzyme F420-dependent [Candidatus Saccharibacteria bacterium]|nr:oxidoreductase, coenzyme F420-dependent [Candidatus Saccharibacteria bacterium]
MIVGILGSGAVGTTLAKGFLAEGHEVYIATREPDSEKAASLKTDLAGATVTDFATAAKSAELAVLCVKSDGVEAALQLAGAENLAGKVVIDTTNVIKPVGDALVYGGGEVSMAEQIQEWLPDSSVVKAFNTVGAATMLNPDFGDQKPTMFIAGDDAEAKQSVSVIVTLFGWEPLDSGGLIQSRSLEAMALVWINNSIATGPHHAFKML